MRGTGSGRVDEDCQKEQSLLDFFSVVATLQSLNGCRRLFQRAVRFMAFGRLLRIMSNPPPRIVFLFFFFFFFLM